MTATPQTLTAHLIVKNAARALDFYRDAFGAEELFRLVEPSGKVGHAEMRIGATGFMLADEYPDFGALGPASIGGTPVKFRLEVADAQAAMTRAVKAGAVEVRPLKDEFYGDRTGMVADPFGHHWFIAQKVEDVSPEEMQRRWTQMLESA
ncbi:MAG: VOC family protein [Maricaulaceae bacterium]|nr:VOC family protein [Maricaulaceae bacterium]